MYEHINFAQFRRAVRSLLVIYFVSTLGTKAHTFGATYARVMIPFFKSKAYVSVSST